MSFNVQKGRSNGYRCCCTQTYIDDPEEFETLEDALNEFPTVADDETLWVEVTDNDTGDVIARGDNDWSYGGGKGSAYLYTRWHGFTPDGPFEVIVDKQGHRVEGQTWAQIINGLKAKKAREELAAAEAQLDRARAQVSALAA